MKKNKVSFWVVVSLVVSVVVGLMLQNNIEVANMFSPLGTIYVNAIKMIMIPLVFSSLVLGITGISDLKKLGKLGGSTIAIFLCTTAMAVVIGLCLSIIFKPGIGIALSSEIYEAKEMPNVIDTIVAIVPSNPLTAFAESNINSTLSI